MNSPPDLAIYGGSKAFPTTFQEKWVRSKAKEKQLVNDLIAGSSVFPTAGNANPTFTILALARRLATHLHHISFNS
jgi:hypothetical protein